MRAWAYEQAGKKEEARRDREAGLREEPTDEASWVARAVACLGTDLDKALADLDQALRLNPRSLSALQTKAHVLSRKAGDRPEALHEAIAVLDRLVEFYPDHAPARSGRGVLFARLGQREAAHKDAEEALRRDTTPATVYQVAGIFARTSSEHPEDVPRALQLLTSALRQGFGFDLLERDRELDCIRDMPEFRRLVEAARTLSPRKP
jgi:tetratricopeptide (TPR) repeat protein